jgi:hypothetical protein
VTEWSLYDAIGTHERFYHVIKNFVDYLARPHNILYSSCMHLNEQFALSGYGFYCNLDPFADMNLSIIKFKQTMDTYKP